MTTKICTKCKVEKPLTGFRFRSDRQKYIPRCNICERAWAKTYNSKLPRDQVNKKAVARYQANPDKARRLRRAGYSGIGIQKYLELENLYGSACNICGTTDKIGGRHLAYDHDHTTGKFRGFLCMNCNQGLGKFFDKIELLESAITYLNKQGVPSWQTLLKHLELKYEDI